MEISKNADIALVGRTTWPCFFVWTMTVRWGITVDDGVMGSGVNFGNQTLFQVIAKWNQRLDGPTKTPYSDLLPTIKLSHYSRIYFLSVISHLNFILKHKGRGEEVERAIGGKGDVSSGGQTRRDGLATHLDCEMGRSSSTDHWPCKMSINSPPPPHIHRHVQLNTRLWRKKGSQGISQVRSRCCGYSTPPLLLHRHHHHPSRQP